MRPTTLLLSTVLACTLLGGCEGGGSPEPNACEGVTCSDHGECVADGDTPRCECAPGFYDDGLECIADEVDPCEGVACSGHGTCVVEGDTSRCECSPGYHDEGLECIADEVDPCEGVACSGHGTCVADGDTSRCECSPGYHDELLECIADEVDPCEGVTCSGHGTCVADGDTPRCECLAGYHDEGLECVADAVDDCTDAAELRRDAIEDGTVFLGGVSLPASTPADEILADQPGFEGVHVQVEGFVTFICPMSRNRALLRDLDGNEILIAGNHAFDLTTALEIGRYVVAEGIFFQWFCRRGPHVNFGDHGGVVGNVICPID